MVAFHVQRGVTVPLSATEFHAGLRQRFPERDGMFFLREQVVEYDPRRLDARELVQLELFVRDEETAIRWLRQQLQRKPQTFQEIHPQFIRELAGWLKHERMIDLAEFLAQNLLRYDGRGEVPSPIHAYLSTNFKELRSLPKDDYALRVKAKDRWYVPDPHKRDRPRRAPHPRPPPRVRRVPRLPPAPPEAVPPRSRPRRLPPGMAGQGLRHDRGGRPQDPRRGAPRRRQAADVVRSGASAPWYPGMKQRPSTPAPKGPAGLNQWKGHTRAGVRWQVMRGDVRLVLSELQANRFDCVVTSPPYYWQRDYKVEGQSDWKTLSPNTWKRLQIPWTKCNGF